MTICFPLLARYRIELYRIELYRKTSEWQEMFFLKLCCYLKAFYGAHCWWRSWLRHCVSGWKVAGSIPDGAIGIFQWQSFRPRYGRGFDSASNGNECQQALRADYITTFICRWSCNLGASYTWTPQGLPYLYKQMRCPYYCLILIEGGLSWKGL